MINILKSKKTVASEPALNGRRSFLWKMGAGVSTALASGAGLASSAHKDDKLSDRVAILEAEKQLRKLHQNYEKLMDNSNYEEVLELFAQDAEVTFNGGVFVSLKHGLSRLYLTHFKSGMTGKRIEPAPGFELDAEQQDLLEVSPDRLCANAAFSFSIQVGRPIESDTSHTSMARLQGEGVQTWWEGGVYNLSYVKDVKDDSWKIRTLEYKTLSRADYRQGRSYAKPIVVAQFSNSYPENLAGPDRLV